VREGKSPIKFFRDYRLLGDDIVIFNKKVADEYQFLIQEVYGIAINQSKSVIGSSKLSQIEFTKRLALEGKEMSSIKRNILTKNSMQNMLDLVDILHERDFIPTDTYNYSAYHFLGSKDQIFFNFMLWVRSNSQAPFIQGITSPCWIDRYSFNKKLLEYRSQAIMEKVNASLFNTKGNLREYFEEFSVPCSSKALGPNEVIDPLRFYPIV
jgi:hypothetical protein